MKKIIARNWEFIKKKKAAMIIRQNTATEHLSLSVCS